MKPMLGALLLLPLMQALALAQAPTADAKEGKLYLDAGLSFGVATMAAPATTKTGFDSVATFGAGFAAEYGITEKIGVFSKFGVGIALDDDPGVLNLGMTFDGSYKVIEKKGDTPAMSVYAGLGFVHLDVDPKVGKSDAATDFVFEFGVQADIGPGDWSLQPFAKVQLVAGSRPFKGYNGVLEIALGAKLLFKLSDQIYLEPGVAFVGGNFQDSVLFGVGIQIRL
ncbi:MAG: hypothetical protein HY293_21095 [Planctomycetes bacterium]|nr:hypothetical protein [Planctomycetota bacterium]